MDLASYLQRELMLVVDEPLTRDELFELISRHVDGLLPALDGDTLKQQLIDRESQSPTSTPEGVAFPHALSEEISRTLIVTVLARQGIDFGHADHPSCDLIFCMFGSTTTPWEHVRLLARLARLVHTNESQQRLRAAQSGEELFEALVEEDRSHA